MINLPASSSVPLPYYDPAPAYPPYPAPVTDSYSTLKIASKNGLYIRSEPGGAIIASALDKTTWKYNQASVFTDGSEKVWVEIKLGQWVKGYSTGWILVKDQPGRYFTDPQIK